MSIDKLNQKLSSFFNSIRGNKLQKNAALGNFSDVKSEDDMAQHAAMINEMLTLPKYQKIINELKASTGVVNVVTYDEYQPLVELLLIKAFPTYTNDLFNLPTVDRPRLSQDQEERRQNAQRTGQPASQAPVEEYYYPQLDSEKEYFISSRFFARQAIQGDASSILPARERLENLLLGSKKKITMDYLKNQEGMSDQLISSIYGRKPTADEVQAYEAVALPAEAAGAPSPDPKTVPIMGVTAKGMAMVRYENAMASISQRFDKIISDLNQAIYEHQIGFKKFTSEEDLQKAKRHREAAIKERMEAVEALDNSAVGRLVDQESVGKKLSRNNDGFINYNPSNNINRLARELLDEISVYMRYIKANIKDPTTHPKKPEEEQAAQENILRRSSSLKELLKQIHTSNPSLEQVKNEWVNLIGECRSREDFVRIVNVSSGKFSFLLKRYNSIIQKNSKVLILDDFDKSAFCTTNAQDHTVELEPGCRQIFANFTGANYTNMGKDQSMIERQNAYSRAIKEWQKQAEEARLAGKPEPPEPLRPSDEKIGGRVAIVISSERINGLPASSIIEMNIARVDKQEAEIIVRHLYREHMEEVKKAVKMRLFREISEQYPNYYESREALIEVNKRKKEIDRKTELEGNISEDHRKAMVRAIVSTKQKDAIDAVMKAIELGKKTIGDTIYDEKVQYDGEEIVKYLRSEVADKVQAGLQGVKKMEREIEQDKYAFEEGSAWGTHVEGVRNKIAFLKIKKGERILHAEKLQKLNAILSADDKLPKGSKNKLTPEQRAKYERERDWRMETLANLDEIIEDHASKSLPHFYLLYGLPGVGKTVWASALADLLDYDLYDIDISDQRNKYVGESERSMRELMNFLSNAQETVFIMDEIDRQISPGHDTGDSGVDQKLTKKLLQFFDNDTKKDNIFVKNRVYFIMTTNDVSQVNGAIKSRASKAQFEVKPPMTISAYKTILDSCIKKYGPLYPDAPIQSINWTDVASALVKQKIGFRFLENTVKLALDEDNSWRQTLELVNKGQMTTEIWKRGVGLPLTLNNLVELASILETESTSPVAELLARRSKQIEPIMKPYIEGSGLPKTMVKNPYTDEMEEQGIIPDEVKRIMEGGATNVVTTSPAESVEFVREKDPATGRMRTVPRVKKDLVQEMEQATGFEEDQPPAQEQDKQMQEQMQEQTPKKKKKKDMEQQTTMTEEKEVQSSTDYLFNYLQKEGLIQDGKLVEAKKKPAKNVVEEPVQETPEEQIAKFESKGIYYTGNVMIAPVTPDTPPVLRDQTNLKK